jgi:methylphosphotriester-DNA--protein-cysteine methyltransferase
MISHSTISANFLRGQIKIGKIRLAGNKKLKIYGTLHCKSGKRMKKENRVFFKDEKEAIDYGYRPCAICMSAKYSEWKIKNYYRRLTMISS